MQKKEDIKRQAFSGAIWKFLERMCAQGVSLVVSIIIARILDPDDYSVVSIVTIFFTFANVFISGGFNTALIQKKNADKVDYSSTMFLSVSVSVVLYLGLFALAPTFARLYQQPLLVPVFRVMGLVLPINAIKSIVCAYISNNLQFKKFFYATIGGTIFSAVVGILMALNGMGAWALVAQQMSNTFIDTIILCITTPLHLPWTISLKKLRSLFSYGWKILASSILIAVYKEINPLFIGLRYSGADLAFYSKGKTYPSMLTSTCNNTLSSVLFPVMAKFQDDKEALLAHTRRFIKVSSFILFPAMLGFYAISDSFVSVLLTEKWMAASPYIKIFCIANMFDVIHTGNCETIKAMGRSDVYLKMEIIKKTSYFIIIGIFMFFSGSPVALALSEIACTIVAIIVNCIPNIKLLNYKVALQIKDVMPNLLLSILMCVFVSSIGYLPVDSLIRLALQIFVGITVYAGIAFATHNENMRYILGVIKKRSSN